MAKECFVHDITVDEFIEVKLKIPKVMDAMDLKALTMKANKLFNLATLEVPTMQSSKPKGRPKGSKTKEVSRGLKSMFSDEILKDIVKYKETNYSYKRMAKRINKDYESNFTKTQIKDKYLNEKKQGRI